MDFIRLLTDSNQNFNEWQFAFRGLPTGWAAWLLWGGAGLVLWWSWRNLARIRSPWERGALFSLRLLGIALTLMVLLQPVIELRNVVRRKTHLAVLLDSSASMGLPAPGGDRSRAAAAWVASHRDDFSRLAERYHVDVFRFDTDLTRVSVDQAATEPRYDGQETGLLQSLGDIAARYPREDLSGVILVSDGCDTLGAKDTTPVKDSARTGCISPTGCDTPLYAFYPPGGAQDVDVGITAVRFDDFAFVHNTVTIEVDLLLRGARATNVVARLDREGQPLASSEATLERDTPTTVQLSFKPSNVGRSLFEVSVPVLPGESVTANNTRRFIIKTIRDKVRVLQVAGRPDWDERFLRQFLKKNPNVDLISFFILRGMEDSYWVPEQELSLIPFPTDELFNTQLHTFDLVIFQNFTYRGYQMAYYLSNIARFVQEGGALVMVGGDLSFGPGGYAATEIEDILPVRIISGGAGFDEQPFSLKLTAEGEKHPIMQFDRDRDRNMAIWANLPALPGVNTSLLPRSDAVTLATHPTLSTAGQPLPVIAVRRVGKGRSMSIAMDAAWRWGFDMVRRGERPQQYDQFWSNAIRWLIKDPDWELLQATPNKDAYRPGEPINISLRLLNRDYLPAGNAAVSVRWKDADGTTTHKDVSTDADGLGSLIVPAPLQPGPLTFDVTATMEDGGQERSSVLVLVDEGSAELARVDVCRAIMDDLAAAASGASKSLDERTNLADLAFNEARARRVADRKDVSLWDNGLLLSVALLLFSVEWFWRRRRLLS